MVKTALCSAVLMAASAHISIYAQDASVEAASISATAQHPILPAGTEVHLRLVDVIDSKTNKRGDRFSLEVVHPVIVDGREWIGSGALAVGEVIEAHKSGMGGNPGRLILAARYVMADDVKIPLRSFIAGAGQDKSSDSLGVSILFGPFGLAITGKNIVIPKGTEVIAKIAEDMSPLKQPENEKTEISND